MSHLSGESEEEILFEIEYAIQHHLVDSFHLVLKLLCDLKDDRRQCTG